MLFTQFQERETIITVNSITILCIIHTEATMGTFLIIRTGLLLHLRLAMILLPTFVIFCRPRITFETCLPLCTIPKCQCQNCPAWTTEVFSLGPIFEIRPRRVLQFFEIGLRCINLSNFENLTEETLLSCIKN